MRSATWLAILFAIALAAQPVRAQSQENALELELNRAANVQDSCRLTFRVRNNLGAGLEKTSIEIALYDDKGVFANRVVFDFGRLPNGRSKVVEYDLPRKCNTISQLQFNEVKECLGEKDLKRECYDKAKTSSRTSIKFEQ